MTPTQRNIRATWRPVIERTLAANRRRRIADIRARHADRLFTERHAGLDQALWQAEKVNRTLEVRIER